MTLKKLLKDVNVKKISGNTDMEITAICHDNRNVIKDCVFVCIEGTKIDGHAFAKDVMERGAAAVVVQHTVGCKNEIIVEDSRSALALIAGNFYDNPASKMTLVGVTGTNGKTTTTILIKQILEKTGAKVGLIGTNENMIGSKIIPTTYTTPEPLQLQELFYEMNCAKCDYVVMEISSHSLAQHRVDGLHFKVGAFTNLTQDHLDLHGTMEAYGAAKAKLFSMCDYGILNADDVYSKKIAENASCEVVTYGANDNTGDVIAKNISLKSNKVEFEVIFTGSIGRAELRIPGKFSVYNGLCAITTCLMLGVKLETILAVLREATGVKGRVEVVPCDQDFTILIDYAHTPDGLENVLTTVKGFAKGRVVVLFGCGGDRDKTKRPKMAAIAANLADFIIVTSDNPRTEVPGKIIEDILTGLTATKAPYVVIENRNEAIHYAVYNAKKDDIIVLAGKGHETYQILGTTKIHFDEREIVAQALKSLAERKK